MTWRSGGSPNFIVRMPARTMKVSSLPGVHVAAASWAGLVTSHVSPSVLEVHLPWSSATCPRWLVRLVRTGRPLKLLRQHDGERHGVHDTEVVGDDSRPPDRPACRFRCRPVSGLRLRPARRWRDRLARRSKWETPIECAGSGAKLRSRLWPRCRRSGDGGCSEVCHSGGCSDVSQRGLLGCVTAGAAVLSCGCRWPVVQPSHVRTGHPLLGFFGRSSNSIGRMIK